MYSIFYLFLIKHPPQVQELQMVPEVQKNHPLPSVQSHQALPWLQADHLNPGYFKQNSHLVWLSMNGNTFSCHFISTKGLVLTVLTGGPAKPAGPGGPPSPRSPCRRKEDRLSVRGMKLWCCLNADLFSSWKSLSYFMCIVFMVQQEKNYP